MRDVLLLSYEFVTFVVGIACFGALLFAARQDRSGLARPFLLLYAAVSVLVMAALVGSILGRPDPDRDVVAFILRYAESFIGRYGVMFFLPFFAHRLFDVEPRRDRVILGVTVFTFAAQHLTEFGLGGWWDDAGDVFEDVMFAGVLAYTIWVGVSRRDGAVGPPELVNRVVVLMLLSVPGLVYDVFLRPDDGWPFFPLWYGATSVVMTLSLLRRRADGTIPRAWDLTEREEEVVRLVQRGLSNKAIARELEISPNTVKTHLRSVFDKSGIRTRTGLMAALAAPMAAARAGPEDHPVTPDG